MTDEEKIEEAQGEPHKEVILFLSKLPRPSQPYEQAILYRKLVGMDDN